MSSWISCYPQSSDWFFKLYELLYVHLPRSQLDSDTVLPGIYFGKIPAYRSLQLLLCSGMATFHVLLSVFLVQQALSQDASDICVDRLTNVKRCLDTSSHNAESKTGVASSDILKRCEGLTSMAGCTVTMPSDCWTQDTFRPLKNMFDFASKLAKGCASPGGKQNMVDLSDCNTKIRADFEKCFNMNVIDQMFAFNTNAKGDNLDFSAACCVIQKGQACYSPSVQKSCGAKGQSALQGIAGFLLATMDCQHVKCN